MKKIILLAGAVLAVLLLCFVFSGVALADKATWHTPQDIYNDFADNGKLDGPGAPYTEEELEAYLNDATIHQYGDPAIIDALDKLVNELLQRNEFPYTGAQIALIAVLAIVLIAAGFLLRRVTRKRTS